MVDSKRIVRNIILGVISITIVWSFVNVSEYAKLYHDSWVVWSFGLVVAASNALSVYRFVESKSWTDRSPALVGVVLFGGMSGLLQTFYYQHDQADLMTSLIFGWFGPIAEGVLSWLLVTVVSENVQAPAQTTDKPKTQRTKPLDKPATQPTDKPAETETNTPDMSPDLSADTTLPADKTAAKKASRQQRIVQLHTEGVTDPAQLSEQLSVSIKTIQRDLAALSLDKRTNGSH